MKKQVKKVDKQEAVEANTAPEVAVNKFAIQGKSKTITGSILNPEMAGQRLILSFANMAGTADTVLSPLFDKKWRKIKEDARGWWATKTGEYKLGAIRELAVQSDTWIIHCLCQDDKMNVDNEALGDCLKKVARVAKDEKATVHVSNEWVKLAPKLPTLVKSKLLDQGITVYFYEEKTPL